MTTEEIRERVIKSYWKKTGMEKICDSSLFWKATIGSDLWNAITEAISLARADERKKVIEEIRKGIHPQINESGIKIILSQIEEMLK